MSRRHIMFIYTLITSPKSHDNELLVTSMKIVEQISTHVDTKRMEYNWFGNGH